MKIHTNDFKNGIKEFGRQIDSKITYTIDNEEIELGAEQLNSISPHYEGSILKSAMRQLDIDSNVEIPLETIINYQFGLKVGNEYEYLNYGNYVVYKAEKQEDTNSYKITCYDKMLYSMIPYEAMNITYPITIRNYLEAICTKLGLTLKNENFANEDKLIQSELYLDSEGNSLDYTFRDVLDEIAEATGSTICINEDTDELEVRYVSNTGTQTTVEGTSIPIENSDDEKLDLQLQGDTTQEGTPTPSTPIAVNVVSGSQEINICGKNLFNPTIQEGTYNQTTYTIDADGKINQSSTDSSAWSDTQKRCFYLEAGIYTIKIFGKDANQRLQLRNLTDNTDIINTINDTRTFTLTDKKLVALKTYGSSGYPVSYYIELEKGKITTPTYEQYKGQTYEIDLDKNLFDKYGNITLNYRLAQDGTNYYDNGYYISPFIKVETNTQYSKNSPTANAYHRVCFYSSNDTSSFISKSEDNTFTTPNNCEYLRFCGLQTEIDTARLEEGTTFSTPIELCKIGDYQDFIKKGTGKNLYDISKFIQGTWQSSSPTNRIVGFLTPTKAGQKYRVTLRNNELDFAIGNTTKNEQSGNTQVQSDSGWQTTDYTYTITGDGYLFLQVKKRYGGNLTPSDLSATDFQVELGETASSFEPYGMKDKWYIEKNINKVVLDGSESWYYYLVDNNQNSLFRNATLATDAIIDNNYKPYCDYYKGITFTTGRANNNIKMNVASSYKYIDIIDNRYTSASDFKSWLSNNNVEVYYILNTPTYTEITDSELIEQLNAPRLLEGLNNVSVSSGDLGSPIKITYTSELDTIDEEYLKDINVNFGEKFGKVNSIVLSRSAESDNIYLRDEESVLENGLCEIKIKDNQIMNGNNRSDFLPELLEALDGLEYYINDFASPGVLYYNLCDKYKVKVGDNYYKCIMFNDEVNVTQGLEENIFTEMPEETETDYTKSDKTDRKINQAYIIVDKQNQEINAVVQNVNTLSTIVDSQGNSIDALGTRLTQTASSITASVSAIQNELDNGVSLVKTTSVLINDAGLNVSTDISKIIAIMSNNAFTITTRGSDSPLTFIGYDENKQTSVAKMDNLTVDKYLTVGYHRTEKYEENYEKRTGWFYIGG